MLIRSLNAIHRYSRIPHSRAPIIVIFSRTGALQSVWRSQSAKSRQVAPCSAAASRGRLARCRRNLRHLGIMEPLRDERNIRESSLRSGRCMRKIRLKSPLNARLAEQFQRELNDSQRAAVTAPDGYNLILAGPGLGQDAGHHLPRRLSDRLGRAARIDHAGHVYQTRRPGDGSADGIADRPAGGTGSGPARFTISAIACSAARPDLLGYQAEFHHPRQRGPARPDPPGHGRRRALRHGQAGPQAGRRAPHDQLSAPTSTVPSPRSSPSARPTWSSGNRRSRRPPRPTPSASSRPTRWTTTTCSSSGAA